MSAGIITTLVVIGMFVLLGWSLFSRLNRTRRNFQVKHSKTFSANQTREPDMKDFAPADPDAS